MSKYCPTNSAIGHRMDLTVLEETSIGGIRVPQDLIREEKLWGWYCWFFGHNRNF